VHRYREGEGLQSAHPCDHDETGGGRKPLPSHLDELEDEGDEPLLDTRIPHHEVPPELQPQVMHFGLILLFHIDSIHVLRSGGVRWAYVGD
jgi:hypothetical protein